MIISPVTTRFDLLTAPWIPCIDDRGSRCELGILEVITRAHELHEVRDPSPLTTTALLRLLIAISRREIVIMDTEEWRDAWERGAFPEDTATRITGACAGRFDLFDATFPFYQSGDIPLAPLPKEVKSVGSLSLEDPTGTGVFHYTHRLEDDHAYCPACCAKALVTLPAFATSGGAGIKPSVNGVPPIYVMPVGETLFHTLLLNYVLPSEDDRTDNEPAWMGNGRVGYKEERGTAGLLESLTWQPRRVRLFPGENGGVCTRCGRESDGLVMSIIYAQGRSLAEGTAPVRDPWAAYTLRQDATRNRIEQIPVRPREHRATWRDLDALFMADLPADDSMRGNRPATLRPRILDQLDDLRHDDALPDKTPLIFQTVGVRTDMKAKIFEWRLDRFDFPPAVLSREAALPVRQALEHADRVERILGDALCRLHPEAKRDRPKWGDIQKAMAQLITTAKSDYWRQVELPFRDALFDSRLVAGVEQQIAWRADWQETVRRIAWTVLEAILDNYDTDAAALERQQAARGVFHSLLKKLMA